MNIEPVNDLIQAGENKRELFVMEWVARGQQAAHLLGSHGPCSPCARPPFSSLSIMSVNDSVGISLLYTNFDNITHYVFVLGIISHVNY